MSVDEMPAGRELDTLVAEKVMGWTLEPIMIDAQADTAQLAICRAALKAVMDAEHKQVIAGLSHAVFSGSTDEDGAPIYNVPFPMPEGDTE